ncbi:cytosolic arginine sensor for mTORC1 subunit 1 isoform X1 [Prinia subflava]|uniref:cytosolic arginine sensor for mTORC1 subunit 1 isoform X1 n=1 Tax=Prinia subflava TaxID=208062 RepID=UPI002FDFE9D5
MRGVPRSLPGHERGHRTLAKRCGAVPERFRADARRSRSDAGRSQGGSGPMRGGPGTVRGGPGPVPGRCGAVPGRSRVRPYSGGGGDSRGGAAAMDLHILEHRVRVLSLARRGLWLYTHPLLKLLFLPQRCRCKFFSLTETPEDYTVMLDEEGFKGTERRPPGRAGGTAGTSSARPQSGSTPGPRGASPGLCLAPSEHARPVPAAPAPGMHRLARPRLSRRGCPRPDGSSRPQLPPGSWCAEPVPARSAGAPDRAQGPPGMPAGSAPGSGSPPVIIAVSNFIPPLRPLRANWSLWQRGAKHRPSQAGRGEPCPAAGSGFWGVLGRFDPSQASPSPRDVPFAAVPTAGDPARAVHHPRRRSCRGYRPNGLSRRVRIPARLPTPKPSCRGRRSRRSGSLAVTQGPRVSAPARGAHARSRAHLLLLWNGTASRALPAPEPELFPMYCFISGPADKYSSIPRGGREVLNNGPASLWPRGAL